MNVEPVVSSGISFFARARPARSAIAPGEFNKAALLGLADHWHDKAPLTQCDRDAEMDVLVVAYRAIFNRRIHDGKLAQSIHGSSGDEGHIRELYARLAFKGLLLSFTQPGNARHIDLVDRVRVRTLLQTLNHALADNGAHLCHRHKIAR